MKPGSPRTGLVTQTWALRSQIPAYSAASATIWAGSGSGVLRRGCGVGKRILGISGSPFLGLRGFRLRELAHGFLDEEEEIQIPNHFHPGGADGGPLRERGSLLQGPTAGWRGFCQFIVKVGAGVVAPAGDGVDEQDLAIRRV